MGKHISVLLDTSISFLNIKPNNIYVDCTLGRAGHSLKILEKLNHTGNLFCFEQDQIAIKESKSILSNTNFKNYEIINSNFQHLNSELFIKNIFKVDGILYDLGVSSPQFDDGKRGFSYNKNSRLDMRMNTNNSLDAYYVVNNYSLEQLLFIFKKYGEEKFSYNIAKNIIKYRANKVIKTTFQLVDIIKNSLPQKVLKKHKHPAKKIFQAIRIEVNDELNALKKSLIQALELLNSKGRIIIITFNSLEDRIVKNIFKSKIISPYEEINKKLPIIKEWESKYILINKKVIRPSLKEISYNSRSKSAKLRVIEKK